MRVGETLTCSPVSGFWPPGQLRRGFLAYFECERADPYRTFLHYNSWYDMGYFSKFDEKAGLGHKSSGDQESFQSIFGCSPSNRMGSQIYLESRRLAEFQRSAMKI